MRWMLMTMALICSSSWADTITFSDAVIREPIPGRSMSAAFMTVHNAGEQVRFTGISEGGLGWQHRAACAHPQRRRHAHA